MGFKLRRELFEVLVGDETRPGFNGIFGITLTVDPGLFDSPEAAHLYVMSKRILARYVAWLHRQGVLRSRRYYWVLEFQKNGWPHWHLVVEATRVPFGILVEGWSRFRPTSAPKVEAVTRLNYKGKAPAFGHVRFTSHTTAMSPRRACWYLSKYFCKPPKNGWPSWVLASTDIVLCKGSKGLFPAKARGPEIFSDEWWAGLDQRIEQKAAVGPKRKRRLRTIRERVDGCGSRTVIVQEPLLAMRDGSIRPGRPVMLDVLDLPWWAVREKLGLPKDQRELVLEVRGKDWTEGDGVEAFYERIHYEMPLVADAAGWRRRGPGGEGGDDVANGAVDVF